MEINYNKIIEIYGKDYINLINENIDEVVKNLNYLNNLGFQDIEDIFERYAFLFLDSSNKFQDKFNKLIANLGSDYVNIIETNLSILEVLNDWEIWFRGIIKKIWY